MKSTHPQREHSNNRPAKSETPSTKNQAATTAPSLRMLTGGPVLRLDPDVVPVSRREAMRNDRGARTTSLNDSSITPHSGAFVTPDLMRTALTPPAPLGGVPLHQDVLHSEEARLRIDLSRVRIHQDTQSVRLADSYHARAFTFGEHIFAGRKAPGLQSAAGREILSHELEHVAEGRLNRKLAETILRLPEADVVAQLAARLAAAPPDKAGYMQVLRTEAGAHAGSAAVRGAINGDLNAGSITLPEAWRAVCLQLIGAENSWPRVLRNFVTGLDGGQFIAPPGMPPATADMVQETAILTAHQAAEGAPMSLFAQYRGLFNSLWTSAPFAGLSDDFDPNSDSRGPRTRRSRDIFTRIYTTNVALQAAYNNNTGGIRAQIDQYVGPDSLNLNASPHLQQLRTLFRARATIASNVVANPAYLAFKTALTPVAQQLDGDERQQIAGSHGWRSIINSTVTGENLRIDLLDFLDTAWQLAPAAAVAPVAPVGLAAPALPPLVLNHDQQAFANNLSLTVAPVSPLISEHEQETLTFSPHSIRNQAGLNVRSTVTLDHANQVRSDNPSEHPWPANSLHGAAHAVDVAVDGGAAGSTDFTGTLRLTSPIGAIAHPPASVLIHVQDDRQAWFIAHVNAGVLFTDQNRSDWLSNLPVGQHVEYYGGQQTITVSPHLIDAGNFADNRGLTVYVRARMTKNGVALPALQLAEFGEHSQIRDLGGTSLVKVGAPAAVDAIHIDVEFLRSPAAAPFHTIPVDFTVHPHAPAFTNAAVLAQLGTDHGTLNSVAAGSVLADMTAAGGQAARISDSIRTGFIKLEPFMIRADAATYVTNHGENPHGMTAYLMGHTAVNDAHTLVAVTGADGWRWPAYPDSVFVNLTPSLVNPAPRSNASIIETIMHESVHALDRRPASSTTIERYKTEFRAYWASGEFDHAPGVGGAPGPLRSTAFDPTLSSRGPKSEKSRAIFDHMYGSDTYPFVKPNYDANTSHFREQVDAFVVPDGINLIVSSNLERLRAAIAAFGGGGFAAHRAHVLALYNAVAMTVDDRREISGNRAWRDLVESKYTGVNRTTIKNDLHIPI
ncbi:MAG: hypothetical protein QOH41_2243 [Blastocatellia bacterium]|nr:hypothetical protein [Blastocatellia bacterium]